MQVPDKILKLVNCFSRLPGVGEKTAMRYSLSMLKWKTENIEEISSRVRDLINLKKCDECGFFCDDVICEICKSYHRASSGVICIVEGPSDCIAIERVGEYKGLYHILGGVLNPLQQIGPSELTIDKLLLRIRERGTKEVILAINPSVEGDITCAYLGNIIPKGVKVEKIGLGIPMGGSLEHLDPLTIHKAIENRRCL